MLFLGGADGGAELGVVPGVHFAVAADDGRLGVHFGDFHGQASVRTWEHVSELLTQSYDEDLELFMGLCGSCTFFSRGGENDRNVKHLPNGGMGDHVVPVERWLEVTHKLVETHLVINDE